MLSIVMTALMSTSSLSTNRQSPLPHWSVATAPLISRHCPIGQSPLPHWSVATAPLVSRHCPIGKSSLPHWSVVTAPLASLRPQCEASKVPEWISLYYILTQSDTHMTQSDTYWHRVWTQDDDDVCFRRCRRRVHNTTPQQGQTVNTSLLTLLANIHRIKQPLALIIIIF